MPENKEKPKAKRNIVLRGLWSEILFGTLVILTCPHQN
jgi:hypothetical protein